MSEKKTKVEEVKVGEDAIKPTDELSQEQALNILIQSARLATKRGAFEIEETELILKAIKVFIPNK